MDRIFFNRISLADNIAYIHENKNNCYTDIVVETYETWPDGHEQIERHEVRCFDPMKRMDFITRFRIGDAVRIDGRLRRKQPDGDYAPFIHALSIVPASIPS